MSHPRQRQERKFDINKTPPSTTFPAIVLSNWIGALIVDWSVIQIQAGIEMQTLHTGRVG